MAHFIGFENFYTEIFMKVFNGEFDNDKNRNYRRTLIRVVKIIMIIITMIIIVIEIAMIKKDKRKESSNSQNNYK